MNECKLFSRAVRRTLMSMALVMIAAQMLIVEGEAGTAPAKSGTTVDQGEFGIFQNGRRVATENFTIQQLAESSVTTSELREGAGGPGSKAEQTSELTLAPNGSLSRYEWKQKFPVQNSATIEPKDQFLNMHSVVDGKVNDLPIFLTSNAVILDDYFFSNREILLWRYLATSCKPHAADSGCDLVRARFPAFIPHRHISVEVYVEFKGYDDIPLNGQPQHLRHFLIQVEGQDWHLWLDANHKLLRISVPDANTEILRQ